MGEAIGKGGLYFLFVPARFLAFIFSKMDAWPGGPGVGRTCARGAARNGTKNML